MSRWLAFDVGCIECGEPSDVIGLYTTEDEAREAVRAAEVEQSADWHGQHSFEVFDLAPHFTSNTQVKEDS